MKHICVKIEYKQAHTYLLFYVYNHTTLIFIIAKSLQHNADDGLVADSKQSSKRSSDDVEALERLGLF